MFVVEYQIVITPLIMSNSSIPKVARRSSLPATRTAADNPDAAGVSAPGSPRAKAQRLYTESRNMELRDAGSKMSAVISPRGLEAKKLSSEELEIIRKQEAELACEIHDNPDDKSS